MRQPINSKIDPLMVDFTLVKSAALSAPDLSVLPRIGEKFEEWLEAFLAGGLGGREETFFQKE